MLWIGKNRKNVEKTSKEPEKEAEQNNLDLPDLPELYSGGDSFDNSPMFSKETEEKPMAMPEPKINLGLNEKEKKMPNFENIKIQPQIKKGNAEANLDNLFIDMGGKQKAPSMAKEMPTSNTDFSNLTNLEMPKAKVNVETKKPMNAVHKEKTNREKIQETIQKQKSSHTTQVHAEDDKNYLEGRTLFVGNRNFLKISEALHELNKIEQMGAMVGIKRRETELAGKFKKELESVYNKLVTIEQTIFGGRK